MNVEPVWYLIWLLGIAAIIYGLALPARTEMRQIAAWITGILLVGGFVPVVEQMIFAYLKRIPPEFEILRTLRYLTPLILLAAGQDRLPPASRQRGFY